MRTKPKKRFYSTLHALLLFVLVFLFAGNNRLFSQSLSGTCLQFSPERCFIAEMGDTEGYSFQVGANKFYSKLVNVGVNLRFSNSLKRADVNHFFQQKSVAYFEPQVNWYPLNSFKGGWRFLNGLGVSTGVSVFYGQFSAENQRETTTPVNGEIDWVSRIKNTEVFDVGYLVNIFYQVPVSKKVLLGARVDFANYKNNDGYSAYGLSVSYKIK